MSELSQSQSEQIVHEFKLRYSYTCGAYIEEDDGCGFPLLCNDFIRHIFKFSCIPKKIAVRISTAPFGTATKIYIKWEYKKYRWSLSPTAEYQPLFPSASYILEAIINLDRECDSCIYVDIAEIKT